MINDADIDTAAFEDAARHNEALRRKGICTHGHWQGHTPTHRPDLKPGQVQCLECKKIFDNEDDLLNERAEILC